MSFTPKQAEIVGCFLQSKDLPHGLTSTDPEFYDAIRAAMIYYTEEIRRVEHGAATRRSALEEVSDQLNYCRDNVGAFKDWLRLQIGDYEPADPYREWSGP